MVPMVLLKPNLYFFVSFVLDTNTDQIKINYSDLSKKNVLHILCYGTKNLKKNILLI